MPEGPDQRGVPDIDMIPADRLPLPGQQRRQHLQRFAGHRVPAVVIGVVAVSGLLHRIAAGDDVQDQPPAMDPGEGVGLLGQQRR